MPVAWMWPIGYGQIHTSSQAGGIASSPIRSSTSGSVTSAPVLVEVLEAACRAGAARCPGPQQSDSLQPWPWTASHARTRAVRQPRRPRSGRRILGPMPSAARRPHRSSARGRDPSRRAAARAWPARAPARPRVLARRFAWLVEQGAAAEERPRADASPRARGGRDARAARVADRVALRGAVGRRRFHAFCARLLHDEALEAGSIRSFARSRPPTGSRCCSSGSTTCTLRRHEIRGNPAPLLASFVARIDRLKDEMVSAERLPALGRALGERGASGGDAERAHAERELEFASVYADHDRLLAERGALDFGDLIAARLPAAAREAARARARWRRASRTCWSTSTRTRTSRRARCCGCCAQDHRNVTVVGDDDQAIYRFRGASREEPARLPARVRGRATIVRLERNYRSGRRILDAAARRGGAGRPSGSRSSCSGSERRRGALLALPLRARAGAGAWPPRPSG